MRKEEINELIFIGWNNGYLSHMLDKNKLKLRLEASWLDAQIGV